MTISHPKMQQLAQLYQYFSRTIIALMIKDITSILLTLRSIDKSYFLYFGCKNELWCP